MTALCPQGSSSHVFSCPVKGDKDKRLAIHLLHINRMPYNMMRLYIIERERKRESLKAT